MSTPEAATAPVTPVVKLPMMPLMLCVAVAALLAVGGSAGAMLYLAKSGRLGTSAAAAPAAAEKKEAAAPTHALAMEPLLANLADADAHAYLRVGITLQVADDTTKAAEKPKEEKPAKGPAPEEAALRDAALDVLGHMQSAALLAADGKENLKKELRAKFASSAPAVKVTDIYFTEFLVQR